MGNTRHTKIGMGQIIGSLLLKEEIIREIFKQNLYISLHNKKTPARTDRSFSQIVLRC
jgi:hypothetical protein